MSGNPVVVTVIQGVRVWSDDESDGVRVVVWSDGVRVKV